MNDDSKHLPSKLLLNTALELVWPTRCSGCESPGSLLCSTCDDSLQRIAPEHACTFCGAPYGFLSCTECYNRDGKESHLFSSAVCSLELDVLSGRVIVLYKDNNEHRLSSILSDVLYASLPSSWISWAHVVTWIPADKKALRRRGFDHMKRVAQSLAHIMEKPAEQILSKKPCSDQRSLNREERKKNLQESFSLLHSAQALPSHVLLIDDVLTTGSTLNAATHKLKEGGVSEVRVASIARAW